MKEPLDPSSLFRSLKEIRPEEEFWTGFWPAVRVGIREDRISRPSLLSPARVLLLGSSAGFMVAAAVLLVAFLVVPSLRMPPRAVPLPGAAQATPLTAREEGTPPPVLEDLASASARVYTFHVGGQSDATDVILIVDEAIDL
jgi:hypothetical protein